MSERSNKTTEQQLDAAVKFVRKVGSIEQARQALDELKKLRKAG